jgi:DNA-binding NtrC family response regulator
MTDSILLVDDEEMFLRSARLALAADGWTNVTIEIDSRKVEELLKSRPFDVVALDLTMPYVSGLELLKHISEHYPETTVIVITGINEIDSVVDCMRKSAFDYIVKPVRQEILCSRIRKAVDHQSSLKETNLLKETILDGSIKNPALFSSIVTSSKRMLNLFRYAEAVAPSELPILITGETGTGKELMARVIHTLSGRKGTFVPVNAASLATSIFADTLFGHTRGAYTGAQQDRKGLIEEAADGTLFLDELGDLDLESQVALLRLLQEREYQPLGSDKPRRSKARIVAATNKKVTPEGPFRRDLYYRLQAHHIHIPPLRERMEDVPLIARSFIEKASEELGKVIHHIPIELDDLLMQHNFPGNIRELEGIVYDAVSQNNSGTLSLQVFKNKIGGSAQNIVSLKTSNDQTANTVSFPHPLPTMKAMEDILIKEALLRCNGNKTLAAHMLGLSRQTLIKRNPT